MVDLSVAVTGVLAIMVTAVAMICIVTVILTNEISKLEAENQNLKDQLIQTIKNEQCDLLPEPVKVGE